MSRKQAKENISLNKFKESMAGIYSTTVNKNTLDESPFAYKDPEQIIEYLKDTVDIEKILKPVYNFKG
jgi:RNA-splicing ligase RtcB